MEILYWIIIIVLFAIGFVGLVYPIIPSVLFIIGGIAAYGLFYSFESFNWMFWIVQALFIILLFGADYISNLIGVKKFGGSKAGVWGSTIGLLLGPFIIPVVGIILGPFIGAVLAELLIERKGIVEAFKIGFGSVIGFITGAFAKFIIQAFMVIYFLFKVL
ncbi:DUF456 domain-containing protein [Bacillus sp. AGMB 02131]|uniref:DUF456 domain-containing protein n=1 Tax=Peribacillus faecalis TaxID=2772559 RepID=A0A927CXS7_9BACI|nr:DUF456 domain-containing protein [Peribacillus faecalis]MBD3107640.1 DUF456 domain-containing protein [Peribacillus faecalis]